MVKRVGSPRVKLLYDIYHMQVQEGDVIATIRESIQYIAHFHTAGVPGRHEIDDTQELYYPAIMRAIADLKFEGYVSHEYGPKGDPLQSLRQAVTTCDVRSAIRSLRDDFSTLTAAVGASGRVASGRLSAAAEAAAIRSAARPTPGPSRRVLPNCWSTLPS